MTMAIPAGASTTVSGSREAMRRSVFLSDDGVVLCATVRALDELGILEPALAERAAVEQLLPALAPSGFGYLRAGLRSLAGQGWLASDPTLDPATTYLDWTAAGRRAMGHRGSYAALGRFLASFLSTDPDAWKQNWSGAQEAEFGALLPLCLGRWGLVDEPEPARSSIAAHLDGALAVPALLTLHAGGRLGGEAPTLSDDGVDAAIGSLLTAQGWLEVDGSWTELGLLVRDYAVHFGIVGSYLPLLARLPDLYRGEVVVSQPTGDSAEWHVNRELNVLASAAAHGRYFADADEIFVELFDREPLDAQPRFIADMGCGDGSWLVHLDDLIRTRTLRGRRLGEHPLLLVGIDLNAAALAPARRRLDAAGVPGLLLSGDVSDPDSLKAALAKHGVAIEDGLHIRSFLDHDRVHTGVGGSALASGRSSGAYVDGRGRPLGAAAVEDDLVAHLGRWAPHVDRHGMVVLEAHCVAPSVARRHLGTLHSVAFDAYHAYSHQYPVEHAAFVDCCRQVGLERVGHRERQYPAGRPFVAVSLNRFVAVSDEAQLPAGQPAAPRQDTWSPDPDVDLEDGEALHRLLFEQGDIRHPRAWCAPATGFVVGRALDAIEARLGELGDDETIAVLDYGAGTGLAAIELLEGCVDRGVDRRLEQLGASLELHLVDLPSAWFAKGHALLGDCAWTRFHSLRSPSGGFRPLAEVLGGRTVDVAIASMVFHLIPPAALDRMVAELTGVLAPGGRLIWSSPDLGPAGPNAVLFHDANRELRARWLAAHGAELDPAARLEGQRRADRRILSRPQRADDVVAALERRLAGTFERPAYEMTAEEVLDAILVPSNQGEYLPEVADRATRERAIRDLMLSEVLPSLRDSSAGTALGLNVRWTVGDHRRLAA
jgi:SAM-dependent methyltransferase